MEPKMKIRNIVIIGMMSAILFALQVAMGLLPLPNIELVSLLIILFTLVFGYQALYIIYIFVILEGFFYGFGPWWINYLYVWTVLFVVTMLFQNKRSPFLWAVVSGAYGLGFGALCSIPYFLTGGIPSGIAYWVSGIPFDIVHGISNFIITLVLFNPIHKLLSKLNGYHELC
jgi:energy-coupling factor transport system substrate-specific component